MFLDHYLPADGFIAATPIYWYGTSAQLKAFYDRTFCYYAASYPKSGEVIEKMQGKRIGLALSSEETFPMVSGADHQPDAGIHPLHALHVCRHRARLRQRARRCPQDPCEPIKAAGRFGREFFTRHTSDYQIDSCALRPGLGLRA